MGRRDRIALVAGLVVIALGYFGMGACQPEASTITGEVVSVAEHGDDHVEICLTDDCRDGQLDGPLPKEGDCVKLTGHHSTLEVETATTC